MSRRKDPYSSSYPSSSYPSYSNSSHLDKDKRKNEQNRKSESITFRFDSNLLNALRNEADQKDISLNTLASQIIKQHVDWHSNAAKAGFISVRKGLIIKILEKVSEEEIPEIAKFVLRNDVKAWIRMMRTQYHVESALDLIETWIKVSGYIYKHDIKGTTHHFMVKHDMGRKWSIYLKELYNNLFSDFGITKPYFEVDDHMLFFIVDTESMV